MIFLVLTALVCASENEEHNQTEAQSRIDTYLTPPQENVLQKHSQAKEVQKSFMSKLASWLFPFGGSDDTAQDVTPAEGQSRAQYAPPPPPHHQEEDKRCSPCNSVPWVPIASNRGPHTLLEFKPPQASHSVQPQQNYGAPPPKPSGHYGPPQEPSGHYGVPQEPSALYGPPQQPSGHYGPPQETSGLYGPPQQPSGLYSPPEQPSGQYGVPSNIHVAPQVPSGHYGPPVIPLTNYGPPPAVIPLSHQQSYNPPQDEYGPPPPPVPASHYGPPHSHDQFIAATQHKEQQYHKQKTQSFKQSSSAKPNNHFSGKPYKFIPVKFMQFPKLELGPKPPNQGTPVTFRPLPQQQKIPLQNLPPDNFAAPIDARPATFVVPPPLQFTAAPSHFPQSNHFGSSVRGPIIPLPNLSLKPVLPIRNYQNFKTRPFNDNLPQQGAYIPVHANGNHHEVEVQPSIPIAGYLASIEHPINVVQSPIVEVTVREQGIDGESFGQVVESTTVRVEKENTKTDFKENPIVVPDGDDAHVAETSNNHTTQEVFDVHNKRGNNNSLGVFSFNGKENSHDQILKDNEELIKQILAIQESTTYSPTTSQKEENYTEFTTPPVDFTAWTPSFFTTNQSPSDKMTPPFESPSPWTNYITSTPTTKKPKQIQVIVPYITNQKPAPFNSPKPEALPMYFTPPSKAPVWPEYLEQESQKVFTAHKPSLIQASNIKELLKGEIDSKKQSVPQLPFDILTLQKTIDDWTQQEFSNKLSIRDESKFTTISKLVPSKNIPNNFFTTKTYSSTVKPDVQYNDHSVASSVQRETKVKKDVADFESNFITLDGSSERPSGEEGVDTSTSRESVYIVTAKPWSKGDADESSLRGNITHKTATFAIRLESENDTVNANKTEKVIYSEWPHLSK